MVTASDLRGIFPPIVTPVTAGDRVDHMGLRHVVRHVLKGGVQGVFTLGGTGNFCSFTAEERYAVAETVVDEVDGRMPVLVGCMDSSTRLTIEHIRCACDAGADAAVIELPYYYFCTEEDLLKHFEIIAEASPLPLVVYHNPEETKLWLSVSLTRRLAKMPGIVGIKDSSYDFVYFQAILSTIDTDQFSIMQGQDALAGPSFLLGATGAILSMATVVPGLVVSLFEAGKAGQLEEVRRLQALLIESEAILREDGKLTTGSFFRGMECAMKVLSICENVVTPPYATPSQERCAQVSRVLNELASTQAIS
jgi:4-hydroxy-tetrahydrodipicolinate synthase